MLCASVCSIIERLQALMLHFDFFTCVSFINFLSTIFFAAVAVGTTVAVLLLLLLVEIQLCYDALACRVSFCSKT